MILAFFGEKIQIIHMTNIDSPFPTWQRYIESAILNVQLYAQA